jgi:hypothetical protein
MEVPMPHSVRHKLKPSQINKGDILHFRNCVWTVEEAPQCKVKYATVHVEQSVEPHTLKMDQEYTVDRMEPTAAETYQLHLDVAEFRITDMIRSAESRRGQELFHLRQNDNPTYFEFKKWIQAHTEFRIWDKVRRVLVTMDGGVWDNDVNVLLQRADQGDLISAVEEVHADLFREVWRGGDGRSTDPMADGQMRVELNVKRSWCDEWTNVFSALDVVRKKMEDAQ